ncbi:MAG TPA: hypothetical protein EYH30_04805 [Anaerolineales bacterium]|nr:hypothetical protein [Anaerolineae bacterium]HIQ01435.1 hypothetical protein [Anaerolineales bacterium]
MGTRGLNVVLRDAGLERYVDNLPPDNLELGAHAREHAALDRAVQAFYGRAGKGTGLLVPGRGYPNRPVM